ncbi:splicing factor 3B subunit 1-like [Dorcoceras hygrometricum]|uniref:Splicing factor 3B subunit 1-like n=1 Tax=Dorcoceras hygrometricum TaxID=472368 RepID=A0A2Z7B7V5_9LAMI|nr:splicing factor 3B subunit 1-like [Dorcoceras hygrometricum]
MVTPSSKQARGFAVQICVLLEEIPDLVLCEPKSFPTLKVLNFKIVGTYVSKKKSIDDGNEGDESVMAKAALVKKKPFTKKKTDPTTVEPVAKKKSTTMGRAAPAKQDLSIVQVIIAETEQIETDFEEPGITRSAEIEMEQSIGVNDEDDNIDGAENEICRKMASFTTPEQFLKEPLRSGEDNDMSGFKQPSKINETEEPDMVEPVVVEVTETVAVETEEEKETDKEKEIEQR